LTDVTRSVPPDIELSDAELPLPDPLVPDAVLPEPLVPDAPPDAFSIRPRTSTRCPTCFCRLLPVSITVPDIPALEPLDDPLPDAELDPDPLDPVDEPDPLVPDALEPEPDAPAPEPLDPEPRDTSVRM